LGHPRVDNDDGRVELPGEGHNRPVIGCSPHYFHLDGILEQAAQGAANAGVAIRNEDTNGRRL
jgi:hypothetical protein